jgi:hypothetical protein
MHPASAVVTQYIVAMHKWEVACDQRAHQEEAGKITYEEKRAIGLEEFGRIRGQFLTSAYWDPDGFSYSTPPNYDPANEVVVECTETSKKKAVVKTRRKRDAEGDIVVYEVALADGQWRIGKRHLLFKNGTKLKLSL